MKYLKKAGLLAAVLLWGVTAPADFSANNGWASDYHDRGIFQSSSSANLKNRPFSQSASLSVSASR